MPKKIIGTLTLSISKSIYIQISPIFLYKSCSIATFRYFKPLLLEIYVRVVALAPDLQRVPFYNIIKFLYYSSTIKLLLLLILIKGLYPSFKALVLCQKSRLALWLLQYVNLCKVVTRFGTRLRTSYNNYSNLSCNVISLM